MYFKTLLPLREDKIHTAAMWWLSMQVYFFRYIFYIFLWNYCLGRRKNKQALTQSTKQHFLQWKKQEGKQRRQDASSELNYLDL